MATKLTAKSAKDKIIALENQSNKNLFKIANILSDVSKLKLYEEDDCKSMQEWGEKMLGYKRQTVTAMVRVSQRFLLGQDTSTLKKDDEKDFTVSQLLELLPMDDKALNQAVEDCEITPNQSCRQLRDIVKTFTALPEKKADKENMPEPQEQLVAEPQEQQAAEPQEQQAADVHEDVNEESPLMQIEITEKDFTFVWDTLQDIPATSPYYNNVQKCLSILANSANKN